MPIRKTGSLPENIDRQFREIIRGVNVIEQQLAKLNQDLRAHGVELAKLNQDLRAHGVDLRGLHTQLSLLKPETIGAPGLADCPIVQVKTATVDTTVSTGTSWMDDGLQIEFTPKYENSILLVSVGGGSIKANHSPEDNIYGLTFYVRLYDVINDTVISDTKYEEYQTGGFGFLSTGIAIQAAYVINGTTIIKLQFRSGDSKMNTTVSGRRTLTVMEIRQF